MTSLFNFENINQQVEFFRYLAALLVRVRFTFTLVVCAVAKCSGSSDSGLSPGRCVLTQRRGWGGGEAGGRGSPPSIRLMLRNQIQKLG